LNGFGLLANERSIRIAKLNKNFSDQTFEQQVMLSITAVANAYWELAFARGNVDVAQHQIDLANKLYSDNKNRLISARWRRWKSFRPKRKWPPPTKT